MRPLLQYRSQPRNHCSTTALLDRFASPHMQHNQEQIAMDGSLKLREGLVPIMKDRIIAGLNSPASTDAIAVWARFYLFSIDA